MDKFHHEPIEKLDNLKVHTSIMLDRLAPELRHVLRYRNFEYVVPAKIEGLTKYIILHKNSLETGKMYNFSHRLSDRQEEITFKIIEERKGEYHIVRTYPTGQTEEIVFSIDKSENDGLWTVHYQGKDYQEIPLTGNTANHIYSQNHDISQGTDIDLKAGAITLHDKLVVEIMNLFHDLPEKGALEISNNYAKGEQKTHAESSSEDIVAYNIIDDEASLTSAEKELLREIYDDQHQKDSYFKYYEFLRYFLYDNKLIYENRDKMFNHEKICGELSVRFIHHVLKEHRLPSGKMILGIDFPSTKHFLRQHKDWIDFAMQYMKETCRHQVNQQGRDEYQGAYDMWQQIKTML